MSIDRPIFIIGPHRSGTTLLYRILGRHPDLGYYNLANRRLVNWPTLAHLLTGLGMPDDPREAQEIWDRFWNADDDVLTAKDATPVIAQWYRTSIKNILHLRGASRFLAKYPRLSLRLAWLEQIFPGGIYIHVIRDWRAVVHSTTARILKRRRRDGGWFGVRIPRWESMDNTVPEIIAARIYRHVTRAIEIQSSTLGERFLSVHYETLCADPIQTVRDVATHCHLRWIDSFEKLIPSKLKNANHKWPDQLDTDLVNTIYREDPDFFSHYESRT